jgi:hypothetical protein
MTVFGLNTAATLSATAAVGALPQQPVVRRYRSGNETPGVIRFDIAPGLLTVRQLELVWLYPLVGHLVQKVSDAVRARTALVIRLDDVPIACRTQPAQLLGPP